MHKTVSKGRKPDPWETIVMDSTDDRPAISNSGPSSPDDSQHVAALRIIVSAFVDLGFGSSAVQQTLRAANDNRRLLAVADDFRRSIHCPHNHKEKS